MRGEAQRRVTPDWAVRNEAALELAGQPVTGRLFYGGGGSWASCIEAEDGDMLAFLAEEEKESGHASTQSPPAAAIPGGRRSRWRARRPCLSGGGSQPGQYEKNGNGHQPMPATFVVERPAPPPEEPGQAPAKPPAPGTLLDANGQEYVA